MKPDRSSESSAPDAARSPKTPKKRIQFLDWARGLAALIMLQGHTFHALIRPELKETSGLYKFSQFFGGEAAAIFLFLTGITYGMGMHKRRELPAGQRVVSALKRARYLFLLAVLFRLQMWMFGLPHSRLADLLKVDVLNLMGATAALLALVAFAGEGLRRARWAILAGIVIAAVAPLMSDLNNSGVLAAWPKALRDYIVPGSSFSIFPWGAFLAFGLAAGNVIPLVPHHAWNRIMQWSALVGFGLIYGGIYFSDLGITVYRNSQFWVDGPGLIACKMGVALLIASVAYLWTEYLSPTVTGGWSWVQLLGTTSLAVYWVHIELVYGIWFTFLKQILEPWQCIVAASILIVMMVGMSWAIHNLPWRAWGKAKLERLRDSFAWVPGSGIIFPAQPEMQPAYVLSEDLAEEAINDPRLRSRSRD